MKNVFYILLGCLYGCFLCGFVANEITAWATLSFRGDMIIGFCGVASFGILCFLFFFGICCCWISCCMEWLPFLVFLCVIFFYIFIVYLEGGGGIFMLAKLFGSFGFLFSFFAWGRKKASALADGFGRKDG